jgi:ribosomal protein S18 acetylase RimI-like enzyme
VTDQPPADVVRPATARPRGQSATASEHEPPTPGESSAIERSLLELPRFSGGEVGDEKDLGAALAVLRGRGPGYNFAACARWSDEETAGRLAALAQAMESIGEWPALLVADGVSQPADLTARLSAAGWVEIERERIMWTRAAPGVPHLDPSLRIEAVTSRTAADYEALEREIFELPADFAAQRTAGLSYSISAGWLRAYLVRVNGAAVATARLAAGDGVAGIFGVGVAASERRRGLGTLVTAVATRAGLAAGHKLVWLSVSELNDPALRVYRQLGFQPGFTWSRWVISAV